MKLAKLLQPWKLTVLTDCDVTGMQIDSRLVTEGDLFIAYPGALADGRQFITNALTAGAAAVLYEPQSLPAGFLPADVKNCYPLNDLSKKLAAIAGRFYEQPSKNLNVIGVTGTNGKTTIAYQLAQAHDLLKEKSAYIGTLGAGGYDCLQPLLNTTPDGLCLQKLLAQYQHHGVETVCMEVSSHALSLQRVDSIHFNQAIFTNLSHEHLDFHHTMEAYAQAKAQLFTMPYLKTAVINHDDSYGKFMAERTAVDCQALTYGLNEASDVYVSKWQTRMTGSELHVTSPWGQHAFETKTLGLFNIYNSLAVFTSLLAHGFHVSDVLPVMANLTATPGRMEVVSQTPCVIVDYAHTPDALENALLALVKLKQGRIIVVFGCGGDRDKGKRPLMGHIAGTHADVVILTSDNPRSEDPDRIIADVAQGLHASASAIKIPHRQEAIAHAISLADMNDIILIAGKGHESYQQIGTERLHFSDQEVVRQLLPTNG